jgi:hypothetical protein
MRGAGRTAGLKLLDVEAEPAGEGVSAVRLVTGEGTIAGRLHAPAPGGDVRARGAAVVWVGGAGGGLDGPAGGLYPRLAARLAREGIASLRVDYRRPNDLEACVLDTLAGVAYLGRLGYTRVALAGHSFGGAVAIEAGAVEDSVVGVAALSSQTAGTERAPELSPKALLLLHGQADTVLPDSCSRYLFKQAGEPKQMILYPGCGHRLDECREDVERDLLGWLRGVLAG